MVGARDAQAQAVEAELLRAESTPDPLGVWLRYSAAAQASGDKAALRALLQRCTRHFARQRKYHSDVRFVRCCVELASLCDDDTAAAEALLRGFRAAGIGAAHALLYEAHASTLEKLHRFAEADVVYAEGVQRCAEPQRRLREHWDDFKHRMQRRVARQKRRELEASGGGGARPSAAAASASSRPPPSGGAAGRSGRLPRGDADAAPAARRTPSQRSPGAPPTNDLSRPPESNSGPSGGGSEKVAAARPSPRVDGDENADPAGGRRPSAAAASEADRDAFAAVNGAISRRLAFSDDVTINTKLAMADVEAMFNSPLPFEDDDGRDDDENDNDGAVAPVPLDPSARGGRSENAAQRGAFQIHADNDHCGGDQFTPPVHGGERGSRLAFEVFEDVPIADGAASGEAPPTAAATREADVEAEFATVHAHDPEVRSGVEESLAEWFAKEAAYHVMDGAPAVAVGAIVELGDDGDDAFRLRLSVQRPCRERCSAMYSVRAQDGSLCTLKLQVPADPWELYVLRRLQLGGAAVGGQVSVPNPRALYDAESRSYLVLDNVVLRSVKEVASLQASRWRAAMLLYVVRSLLECLSAMLHAHVVHSRISVDTVVISAVGGAQRTGVLLTDFESAVALDLHAANARFLSDAVALPTAWRFDADAKAVAALIDELMPASAGEAADAGAVSALRSARQVLSAASADDAEYVRVLDEARQCVTAGLTGDAQELRDELVALASSDL